MNNLPFMESVSRANSGFRLYWYRRQIGRPISLWGTLREWPRRLWFEWSRSSGDPRE
jgi:hypothetical protein